MKDAETMGSPQFAYEKDSISIISQNLFNYPKKNKLGRNQIEWYKNKYSADIYAFQEYPVWGRGKTFSTSFELSDKDYQCDVQEAENVWKENFPWSDFPDTYWRELLITFKGVPVRIINVHISARYTDQIRLVLLKRLGQLRDEAVILLGDFNAAFSYQTNKVIAENDLFLSMIVAQGYKEKNAKDENNDHPHYTFVWKDTKTDTCERKKLDHVFLSEEIRKSGWDISLEYIDEINLNFKKHSAEAFTDHSGMKVTIRIEKES